MSARMDPFVLRGLILGLGGLALLVVMVLAVPANRKEDVLPPPAIALPETPTTATPEETREILGAVLRRKWGGVHPIKPDSPAQSLVLVNRSVCFAASDTKGCESAIRIINRSGRLGEHVPRKLREGLVSFNTDPVLLDLSVPGTRLARFEDIDEIFAGGPETDPWEKFHSVYPGASGFIRISVPVISRDRQEALFYGAHHCDGLCGSGYLFYLARSSSGWEVRIEEMLWIS